MATHYGVAILPARVRAPRDKAKVETAVQIVERQILAKLRHHRSFSLEELNQAIGQHLQVLNTKPFQKLAGSRQSLFESLDKPALKPLPVTPYEFALWKKTTLHIDYHVEVDGHNYSVLYRFMKKRLDICITSSVIECLDRGRRVASHHRIRDKGRHTTMTEHMPSLHRQYQQWTPERFLRWAATIGFLPQPPLHP
jgi:transposase